MSRQTLFRRFLRHPGRVGALWPSSPSLCRMMVSRIGVEQAKLVVELGPGTGVITREIIRMLPAGGRFMAVELDELLCLQLRRNFPGVEILHDSRRSRRYSGSGGFLRRMRSFPAFPGRCFPNRSSARFSTRLPGVSRRTGGSPPSPICRG